MAPNRRNGRTINLVDSLLAAAYLILANLGHRQHFLGAPGLAVDAGRKHADSGILHYD